MRTKVIAGSVSALLFFSLMTLPVPASGTPNMHQQTLMPDSNVIKPGKRKAVLILSDGRKIVLSGKDTLSYVTKTGVTIKIDSLGIAYKNKNLKVKPATKPEKKNESKS